MLELDTTPLDKHFCNHVVVHTRTCSYEHVLHIIYYVVSPSILIHEETEAWEVKQSFKHILSFGERGRAGMMPLTIPPDVSRCISIFHLSS